ncbi:hypothetical protein Acsp02_38570 [Actinoplanes sp. NBRC 103695]|nr:hypothetical protein Acsp02_38570 [Actinoplanes sp. NBRC 103695]
MILGAIAVDAWAAVGASGPSSDIPTMAAATILTRNMELPFALAESFLRALGPPALS